MENLLENLPDLSFASDENSDDADESSGDQSSAIFSRSAHLKSLGVELVNPAVDTPSPEVLNNITKFEDNIFTKDTDILGKDNSLSVLEKEAFARKEANSSKEIDWCKFKSEFSESLQASEEKIVSEDGNIPVHDFKQQLLLNAILSMHSDTGAHQESLEDATISVETPKSPLKLRRRLLSMNSLETIHENELDKLLESDTLLSHSQPTVAIGDGQLVAPPALRLVWEKEDTGQLMKELEKLTITKAAEATQSESKHTSGWRNPSNELCSSTRALNGNKDNGPIFLDLRPGPAKETKAVERNDRSTSDDDESDDPYAWIAQRRHIKSTLHTSHPFSPLATQPSVKKAELSPLELKVEKSNAQTSPTKTSTKDNGIPISNAIRSEPINTPAIAPFKYSNCHPADFKRQRNSSSLTLSSSLSDGEANIFEMPGANKGESPSASPTKASLATSPTKAKKSKNQAKKSKKSRKKDKDTTSVKKDSSKSSQRKLARALVLQRIRNDSLTTSSDEEHCLTPTDTESSKLSSSVSSCDGLACQGSEEDFLVEMDTGQLKQRLQKIIQAKKPPVLFVTPATNTVFHEGVSFEAQMSSTDLICPTDALLTIPLSEHGLVSIPAEIEEEGELDLQTQLYLHLLILTWLMSQASSDHHNKTVVEATSSNEQTVILQEVRDESKQSDRSRKHFSITGLLQTILDGCPSLLVGVCVSAELKRSKKSEGVWFNVTPDAELVNTISNKLTTRLHNKSLNEVIDPIIGNSDIQSLIPVSVLEILRQIGQLPLTSFLTVQEDISPLTTPLSFYWHSGYHISSLPSDDSLKSQPTVATTVCTLEGHSLTNHSLVFTTLRTAYSNAFYLAGLRMVYEDKSENSNGGEMTLALALRAPDAIYRWLDVVGPEDSNLAKVTDPDSLNAKFASPNSTTLKCVRTPYSILSTVAKWFGGRACLKTGSVLGISDPRTKFERRKRQRVRFSESESEDGLPSPALDLTFSPLTSNRSCLITQAYTKVLLVVAPLVPPCLYGTVLSSCSKMGFNILGMKRIRLNSKRASTIHIPKLYLANFTPSSTPPSPALDFITHPLATEHAQNAPPFPSLVLHLGAENAKLHCLSLKETICSDLKATVKVNANLEISTVSLNTPDSILHMTETSHETTKLLGSFSLPNAVSGSLPKLHEERKCGGPFMEELCFVAVPQCNSLPKLVNLLNNVYQLRLPNGVTVSAKHSDDRHMENLGGFELLGFKIIPQIPRFHAKRLCPLANTDPAYQTAVNLLSDVPASLLLFRGLDCNQRLTTLLKPTITPRRSLHTTSLQQQLEIVISKDFEDAFNLSSIFLSDKEIFSDSASLGMAPYMPPSWIQDMSILQDLQAPPDSLLSVASVSISEPRLVVKVLDKLCRSGFIFAAMRAVEVRREESETVLEDLEINTELSEPSGSEACLVVCVLRVNAVWHLRHSLSALIEQQRRSTTNKSFTVNCSDTFLTALAEVKQYFPEGICCAPVSSIQQYKIQSEESDSFDELVLPERCLPSSDSSLLGFVSPLLETTAMVLPSSLLESQKHSSVGCVEIIEFLTQSGFKIQGLKMVTLSVGVVRELLALCNCLDTVMADNLCHGPCLILVVRRDNAASCCLSIFKSASLRSYRPRHGSIEELLAQMIVPNNAQSAKATLKLLKVS